MIERGTGDLVVTNSIAGHTAVPVGAELHRSKAHGSGLRPHYRRQFSTLSIRVMETAPGPVVTALLYE